MKIAWYTPFSANSAIGHFSQMVVRELRRLDIDVLIVRSEKRNAAMRSVPPVCRQEKWAWAADFGRNPAKPLSAYDLVVYNVGDHYEYHAYCFAHQKHAPGLTVLHDYSLHNAANHYCHECSFTNGHYVDYLRDEHGRQGAAALQQARRAGDDNTWFQDRSSQFPIYRWALRETLGVVTHARFYQTAVYRSLGCPVTSIPLAYDSPWEPPDEDKLGRGNRTDKMTLLTVGAVNRNKRYDAVIQAIARSPRLRNRLRFRIVGAASRNVRQQMRRVQQNEVHPIDVALTGYVDRDTLRRELAEADLISCLRYPALEGASASVIEGLLTGKPVITCRTGCYAEIPDNLVYSVSPDNRVPDLTRALEQIVDDYEQARRRGAKARCWALQRHSAEAYADQLLQFLPVVLSNAPIMKLMERLAGQLIDWNVPANDLLLSRIDQAVSRMFGEPEEERRAA